MDLYRAQQFYDEIVKPTCKEFLERPYDERRGVLAALCLNHMADHMAHQLWHENEASRMVSQYRKYLSENCSHDFALIRDIADAAKHVKLHRQSAIASEFSNVSSRETAWGELPYGEFAWGGGETVVVGTDDGQYLHGMHAIVQEIMKMWEAELTRNYPPIL
jgi:hypothetical protein